MNKKYRKEIPRHRDQPDGTPGMSITREYVVDTDAHTISLFDDGAFAGMNAIEEKAIPAWIDAFKRCGYWEVKHDENEIQKTDRGRAG